MKYSYEAQMAVLKDVVDALVDLPSSDAVLPGHEAEFEEWRINMKKNLIAIYNSFRINEDGIDYRSMYGDIVTLQVELEESHDDPALGRPDYKLIQALAATYTLQDYLAGEIAETSDAEEQDELQLSPEEAWKDFIENYAPEDLKEAVQHEES